ncbi:MAG: BadF/BadG/BcrA/BcrD ATPase family protein [Candidatus Limnocylindrales bacterium]
MHLLGVDGGASKTVAVVADETGRVVGSGRAGGSDFHGPDEESALDELARAIVAAIAEAGIPPSDVMSAVLACCGADWPEDFADIRVGVMRRIALGAEPEVVNDGFGTLRAGTPDGVGLAVALGTGLSVCAAGPTGRWHSSYWADDAGAVSLGRASVRAAVRAELGLGSATALAQAVPEALGLPTAAAALHALTRRRGCRLPPTAGSPRSHFERPPLAIRWRRISSKMSFASAPKRRSWPCVRPGLNRAPFRSYWREGSFAGTRASSASALRHGSRPVRSSTRLLEPVGGALLLAFDAAGAVPNPGHLRATFPDRAWFDTRGIGASRS